MVNLDDEIFASSKAAGYNLIQSSKATASVDARTGTPILDIADLRGEGVVARESPNDAFDTSSA